MKCFTTLTLALVLVLAHSATALNSAFARNFAMMAEMGLNPDGTPIADNDNDNDIRIQTFDPTSTQPPPEDIQPEYVTLPVDAFAASKNQLSSYHGTFNNRFWASTTYYVPGSPVFLYDVGEADASVNAQFRLSDPSSFFRQLVQKYNGIGIVWEHRFYGNSSPTPVDVNTSAEEFEFLTTQQSLADVAGFAAPISRPGINASLTPDATPWVFVGGSYPGMRAAFMRSRYPSTVFAAWASSAPVQARLDLSGYFDPMWDGLQRYGFGNCTRDVQAAVRWVDRELDASPGRAAAVKRVFLGKGAEANSHAAFADALTTVWGAWMTYGVEGGVVGLRKFCDWIETDMDGLAPKVAGRDGWAQSKGAEWVARRWARYPWWVGNVNRYLETECSGSEDVAGQCDLNRKFTDPSLISWTWQYCTQWGFFQSANLGPRQLVSKYNSLAHQQDICKRQFPTGLPPAPDVDATNRAFGGWSIRPSNTYWSNGEFDPWRTLAPDAKPRVQMNRNIPRCGQEGELFGYVLPNSQHCYDFRTVGKAGEISRGLFTEALGSWLRCWRPRKKPGGGRPWTA